MVKHNKRPRFLHVYADRHGRQRIYFRKIGLPSTSLPGPLFSDKFWASYYKALEAKPGDNLNKEQGGVGKSSTQAGSMNELIALYYQSAAFTQLAPSTQRAYRGQIEEFRRQHGDKSIAGFKTKHVDAILGELAKRSKSQAHSLRKRLRMLMALAVTWEYRSDNPVLTAQRVKFKEKGFRTWTEEDIAQFRAHWAPGTQQRLALEILLNTGLRRSDAVRLGRQHRQGDWHSVKLRKSGETVTVLIPINATLAEHLAYAPLSSLTYLVTQHGSSRSEKAFTNWFREAAIASGLPSNSSPHGLRKACCRRLAEAGCTTTEIMSITGQSLAVVERYIKEFNKELAASKAMNKLAGQFA